MKRLTRPVSLAALVLLSAAPLAAQDGGAIDSSFLAGMEWRSIGPANMGGRVTDVEGIGSPSKTFFVAAAGGGIWKTINNGTTFRPVFDVGRVISMGDLAIAPSDTLQVWAGTGEEDSRNSISPGGGIYKSVDGGLTWKLMGLEATQAIGRIVVHPTNPDIVYVAALGHIWDSNPERGLYRTMDGGRTWKLIKFVSDKAGFVDVAMDPRDPNVLFASSWERVRGPYFLNSGGPGSALWKTTDGGDTWTEVKGGGFPETMKGRIGIAIAPSNPDIMYALVEAEKGKDGHGNGLYRSADGGRTWTFMNDRDSRPFYYSQVRVDPKDPDRVYWSSTPVQYSNDGGKTYGNATVGIHVDHHAMWIDPNDANHFIVGDDGGVSQTWDRGGTYNFLNTFAIGQFYAVSYDMAVPYNVCGGLQDNGSWCGPSRRAEGPITNAMWFNAGGGDGFYTAQDPRNANIVYSESQGGNMGRYDLVSGERTALQKPSWRDRYTEFEDSLIIERGDTTKQVSAEVQAHLADLRRKQVADSSALDLRWNWNTPFFLSPYDPDVFYAGSNRVMKSTHRGDDLTPISPDLSKRDTMKIRVSTQTTGGITPDVTGAETYGTITALAESPIHKGMLFAGTDDGNVWISHNDGGDWDDLTPRFKGLVPDTTWVTRIEPSHFDENTFYVTFDGHRTNDFTPYAFVTTDGGRTFRSIAQTLPRGGPDFVRVIREDPVNHDLLFLGTDVGAYVSVDRGAHWQRFMTGLPTVPIHDLKIHPRAHELIAGTHGRSIWIVDIGPLEHFSPALLADNHLFEPKPAFQYGDRPVGGGNPGHEVFEAESPDYGAALTYWVGKPAAGAVADGAGNRDQDGGQAAARDGEGNGRRQRPRAQLIVTDEHGDTVQTVQGPATAGLHTVTWDFRAKAEPPEPLSPSERRDSIIADRRLDVVADSMIEAGSDEAMVKRIVAAMRSGDTDQLFRGFGGGRGGEAEGGFRARPGETPVSAPGARRGGQGGQEGQGRPPIDTDLARDIGRAVRGQSRGGFGGGRNRGETVDPGDYTVTLVLNGTTMSRKLHIERVNGNGGSSFGFDEEGEEPGGR